MFTGQQYWDKEDIQMDWPSPKCWTTT